MSETQDDEVSELLNTWGLSDLKAKFKANYIVLQALEFLTEDDIIELIPKIGQRAIFRGRLLLWRQQHGMCAPPPLKMVKLEPTTEPSTEPSSKEKVEPLKPSVTNESPPQIVHKVYGTLTKCSPPLKKTISNTSRPDIQSKVQQFYISPVVEACPPPPALHQCNSPIQILSSSAPELEPASEPIHAPGTVHLPVTATSIPVSAATPPPLPVETSPLTPFVTSIIRVETNCDKKKGNSKKCNSNASKNVNRTTILQRLKTSERTPKCLNGDSFQEQFEQIALKIEPPCPESESQEQPQSSLYSTVKLKTELADTTNWDEYTEPELEPVAEVEPEPLLEPMPGQNLHTEPEDIRPDSNRIRIEKIESLDSDSAPDFDGENDPITYPLGRIAPDPISSKLPGKRRTWFDAKAKLDIRRILMSSEMGRHVLSYYETNERLDIGRRRLLVDEIVEHCWHAGRRITVGDCAIIATEIIEIFPNERLEDYYKEIAGKSNPKSPIYNRYRSMNRQFLIEKEAIKRKKSIKSPQLDCIELDDNIIIS